jgi:hypothetical protein
MPQPQIFRLVYSKQEALAWYKAANYLDCRIRAYHRECTDTDTAPSVSLVDIDIEHFDTTEEFELCAAKTRANFKEILDAKPTQLWTGGGYHFIQPQFAIVLEKVERFKQFDRPSVQFMRFEEQLLSDKKADQNHSNNVSFDNCYFRIPGSLNSSRVRFNEKVEIIDIPPDAEVRVVQCWDGNKPSIKPLLSRYYIWRQAAVARDIDKQMDARKYNHWRSRGKDGKKTFQWIEKLLDKPLGDHRYYCIWRILVPYLINVKGASRHDTFETIMSWLDKCNSLKRLGFSPKQKVDYVLDHVGSCYPISRADLEQQNNLLYTWLKNEGIVH